MPHVLTIRNQFAFGDITWPELTSFFVAESVDLIRCELLNISSEASQGAGGWGHGADFPRGGDSRASCQLKNQSMNVRPCQGSFKSSFDPRCRQR